MEKAVSSFWGESFDWIGMLVVDPQSVQVKFNNIFNQTMIAAVIMRQMFQTYG